MRSSLVVSGSNVEQIRRCTVAVEGVVQGVGFRPFVYRLAQRDRLAGCVHNDGRGVLIELQGQESGIQRFLDALVSEAPAAARPTRLTLTWSEPRVDATGFRIDVSLRGGPPVLFPAPDLGTCAACLRELGRPAGAAIPLSVPELHRVRAALHHHRRAALRPRAHVDGDLRDVRGVPRRVSRPGNRRFHAEPTACHDCGPQLVIMDADGRRACRGAHLTGGGRAALRAGDRRAQGPRRLPPGLRRDERQKPSASCAAARAARPSRWPSWCETSAAAGGCASSRPLSASSSARPRGRSCSSSGARTPRPALGRRGGPAPARARRDAALHAAASSPPRGGRCAARHDEREPPR